MWLRLAVVKVVEGFVVGHRLLCRFPRLWVAVMAAAVRLGLYAH